MSEEQITEVEELVGLVYDAFIDAQDTDTVSKYLDDLLKTVGSEKKSEELSNI